MAEETEKFEELEAVFASARAEAPPVSADLAARVLADAEAVQAEFGQKAGPAPAPTAGAWFRQFSDLFGGWAGLGGLATACAAGVWIGFAPPAAWPDPASLVLQDAEAAYLFEGEELAFLFIGDEG